MKRPVRLGRAGSKRTSNEGLSGLLRVALELSGEASGEPAMTANYRGFAIDCFRWAEQASDASQRDNLIDIARLWKNVAIKMDQHVTMANDAPALLRALRAKLD